MADTENLPAVIPPGALTTPTDTHVMPSLIANAGDAAPPTATQPSHDNAKTGR